MKRLFLMLPVVLAVLVVGAASAGVEVIDYECLNHIDDDGDGLVDYPNDPGCYSSFDPDEDDPPPGVEPPRLDELLATDYTTEWSEQTYTQDFQYLTATRTGTSISTAQGSGADSGPTPRIGCRKVTVTHTSKDWLHIRVMYKWHQTKHWCWNYGGLIYPRITSVSVGTSVSNVDSCCVVYNGIVGAQQYYYLWRGSPTGGHFSFRQGSVGNCILRYGCVSSQYPWSKIWVNGNGAWAADEGT
jgi:hypothetical protein